MSRSASFRIAGRLGVSTTLAMFGLIVVGSVVRTTGSGLACPDWPLCHGRLLPLENFNVFIEWFHRLLALMVSLLLFGTVGWTLARRETRERLGGLAALAVVLLFAQILLGALTVWKLLHPAVVSSHLATALLLFSTVVAITQVSFAESEAESGLPLRPAGLLPALGAGTALIFGQAVLGGIVSTSHAGLACPDWPTCDGQWFPPLEGGIALQMFHRWGAYLVTVWMLFVTLKARSAPDAGIRAGASMAFGLTLSQVVLGVCNVFLGTPVWLSAMHLATAAALLALMVTLSLRAARLPAAERASGLVAAR
jgi:cytochrome c oxidase assembly protein subunit 15